ncbi:MAG: hypothetical protein JSV79_04975 [Armatimonadota bacterium]|nr:MAG: hypothetical protein JSV79_04975 [Armatimonadota bacterium]
MTERMDDRQDECVLERARREFAALAEERGLVGTPVRITARTLSTDEAVGTPMYDDLPILRGKELMIEAEFCGAKGHAFTSAPSSWEGSIRSLLAFPLDTNHQRALLTAAMNAVLRSLGLVDRTIHCHSEDIARCGEQMAADLRRERGPIHVGVVGYQPGLLAGLAEHFGSGNVRFVDLLQENIGRRVGGVEIWDGLTRAEDLVRESDLVLATGSTVANGTADGLLRLARKHDTPLLLYGVTAAAVCYLCGIKRLCLLAA